MIQKRYKKTERLAAAQVLKAQLEEMPVILAELELPKMVDEFPNHRQILRVENVNIAITSKEIIIRPQRILIHEVTGKESDRNLFVPSWVITATSLSSKVDAQGQREFYEMEYFNTETGEIATTDMVEVGVDEEGNPVLEEQTLPELADEVFLLPSIPYLMSFAKQVPLPSLIEMFSGQFVSDNYEVWLKPDAE